MNLDALIWSLILLAFVAANVPFVIRRSLFFPWWGKLTGARGLGVKLLELLLLYVLLGLLAYWIEGRAGQVHVQGWEFYAVTLPVFLTFAFPGFVYRYLGRDVVRDEGI